MNARGPAKSAHGALRIGEADDAYEREADRVADELSSASPGKRHWSFSEIGMRAPLQRKCACGGSSDEGGECEECKQKKEGARVQRKAVSTGEPGSAPPIVHEVLNSPGQPLDRATRDFFEPKFGYDLGQVRVHTDRKAASSAQAVRAAAYTVGSHIVFGESRYSPGGKDGRFLLGHELTHVVQQTPVLSRQPVKTDSPKQRSASARLAEFATVIETYANKASRRVSGLGSGGDLDAIQRNISTALTGAAGLRQLAAKGNDHLAAGILANFTRAKMRTAAGKLAPASVPEKISDITPTTPTQLAAKSLDISQPTDRAEIEADQVARAVTSGQPASVFAHSAGLGLYRLRSEADLAAEEEELAGLEEVTEGAELAEVALAPEEIAVVTGVLAGIGPVGWAVIAVGVVLVGIGLWYLATEDAVHKPTTPAPAPAPTATPQQAPPPAPKPVPKECEETAKRHNSENCKMTATADHSGQDPVADLYCEQITGDPCEYRTRGASGTAHFDSVKGDTAVECKCGYLDFVRKAKAGNKWAKRVLDDKLEQVRRHLRVAKDCGIKYQIFVSNKEVQDWFKGELGDEVDIDVKESELCD